MIHLLLDPARRCGLAAVLAISVCGASALGDDSYAEEFLYQGRLADGIVHLEEELEDPPGGQAEADLRFRLGITRFFRAFEQLTQRQYQYGLFAERGPGVPFLRMVAGRNPNPETISVDDFRAMIVEFSEGLASAEETFANTGRRASLNVIVPKMRLDLNGDGQAAADEDLWAVLEPFGLQWMGDAGEEFRVRFDDADVTWFQGYCHLLMAACDVLLAYDFEEQFACSAHLFYPRPVTPYAFFKEEGVGPFEGFNTQNIFDVIALIHNVNYELKEPDRMPRALAHLEQVIALSRETWARVRRETDNNYEWIPGPTQTSAMAGLRVPTQLADSWDRFLDEAEAILQGKKLLPFWRGIPGGISPFARTFTPNDKVGINLHKVFTEPRRFDLALWLQGTAAQPYLEEGEITDPELWIALNRSFGGRFFGFAMWFN